MAVLEGSLFSDCRQLEGGLRFYITNRGDLSRKERTHYAKDTDPSEGHEDQTHPRAKQACGGGGQAQEARTGPSGHRSSTTLNAHSCFSRSGLQAWFLPLGTGQVWRGL